MFKQDSLTEQATLKQWAKALGKNSGQEKGKTKAVGHGIRRKKLGGQEKGKTKALGQCIKEKLQGGQENGKKAVGQGIRKKTRGPR